MYVYVYTHTDHGLYKCIYFTKSLLKAISIRKVEKSLLAVTNHYISKFLITHTKLKRLVWILCFWFLVFGNYSLKGFDVNIMKHQ